MREPLMSNPLNWATGAIEDLRAWRASQPEVIHPVLPDDVMINMLAPKADCPGGLSFHPTAPLAGAVVYFHGGGFCVGSPETHRINCAWIAHITRRPVYSIRYPLAPEQVLPAQAQAASAAVQRQLEQHQSLWLMGDSAGGLVALWAYAALPSALCARISGMLLLYPTAGPLHGQRRNDPAAEAEGLGPEAIAKMYQQMDPGQLCGAQPLFDPLHSAFPPLPPLRILAAAADPVLVDAELLAARHHAELIVVPDAGHAFLAQLPAPWALAALSDALAPLRQMTSPPPSDPPAFG